ncbi:MULTISPECIES: HpaII family restriction endonuclease [Streptococcus]|uniref:HpaII family restriction endonuclease n=1 Tax=Streptococcus TaxID=1301 RepID=UPI00143F7012|nr:HpaII family restriction endonuclease [Streptococcus sp.]NKN41411.1 HpaII family restriction endonuclease [Streptococcus alactolyticus]NKN85997.1 HpaII family restriction endonuclease [Streptococcus agalactiae]
MSSCRISTDENLEKVEKSFYVILSAIKQEGAINKEYKRIEFTNKVLLLVNNLECIEIPYEEFEFFSQIVLESIKSGKGTFEIPEIEPFLQKIKITKIKASNDSKKDIIFKIHDDFTGAEPIIGFSIKSYIGNKPTLLNASGAIKVQYKLSRPLSTYEVEFLHNINTRTKIKDRVEYIKDKGVLLDFDSMINETFNRNLQMVDYRMPEILGNLFLESYFVEGKSISDVVDKYCDEFSEDKEIIIHKVKDLLVAVALGMEPNTKWTGLEDANGGYIVVKDDGEVLCYHIYDRNKLRNYLFRNTKFDSPSSS